MFPCAYVLKHKHLIRRFFLNYLRFCLVTVRIYNAPSRVLRKLISSICEVGAAERVFNSDVTYCTVRR